MTKKIRNFDVSFGMENLMKEAGIFINKKNIKANKYEQFFKF
jgi:hypothetical protein